MGWYCVDDADSSKMTNRFGVHVEISAKLGHATRISGVQIGLYECHAVTYGPFTVTGGYILIGSDRVTGGYVMTGGNKVTGGKRHDRWQYGYRRLNSDRWRCGEEPISLSRPVTLCVRTGRTEAITVATDDRG